MCFGFLSLLCIFKCHSKCIILGSHLSLAVLFSFILLGNQSTTKKTISDTDDELENCQHGRKTWKHICYFLSDGSFCITFILTPFPTSWGRWPAVQGFMKDQASVSACIMESMPPKWNTKQYNSKCKMYDTNKNTITPYTDVMKKVPCWLQAKIKQ